MTAGVLTMTMLAGCSQSATSSAAKNPKGSTASSPSSTTSSMVPPSPGGAANDPGRSPDRTGGGVVDHDWNNQRYDIDWGNGRVSVQFHNGTAAGPAASGFTPQARIKDVRFTHTGMPAYGGVGVEGDLNSDGVNDAIVSIVIDVAPTWSVTEQHVFLGPEPVRGVGQVTGEFLGDDWMGEGVPVVISSFKESDPRCCPSIETREIWKVQGGALVRTYHQDTDIG